MKVRDTGPGPGNGSGATAATGSLGGPSGTGPTGAGGGPTGPATATSGGMALGPANRPVGALGDLRVEPPGATSRRRIPELVLGIFLVAGCALAAVLIAAAGRERTPVVTLAHDIDRGHVLTKDDLKTVYVGSDSAIAYIRNGDEGEILGQAALADLGAGSILTKREFVDPSQLTQSGDGLVGCKLEIGSLPSGDLATGDVVSVAVVDQGGEGKIVAQSATVVEVRKLDDVPGQAEQWWVTLKASESDAEQLATATVGDNHPVKLILVRR